MKKQSISKEVGEKKTMLAEKLLGLKDKWPYSEKMEWCLRNGYNTESITKGYFKGGIGSIVVAEKLVEVIERYVRDNETVPA